MDKYDFLIRQKIEQSLWKNGKSRSDEEMDKVRRQSLIIKMFMAFFVFPAAGLVGALVLWHFIKLLAALNGYASIN